MKMVKSLLLGSAAGLVAVAGAQAADLPVKAKPVQYVKICSLYGVGFYYIPGTDMCIKIGGWVRAEYGWGQNGNFAWGWANANVNNRATNNSDCPCSRLHHGGRPQPDRIRHGARLHRGRLSAKRARRRRERSELVQREPRLHPVGGLHVRPRAVVLRLLQRAGDVVLGRLPAAPTPVTAAWIVMAYTAQFGNGFSATICRRTPRRTQIIAGDLAVVGQASGSAYRRRRRCKCWLRRLPGSGHRRQPAHRPGLGFCPDHGRRASGQSRSTTTDAASIGASPEGSGHPDDKWAGSSAPASS